MKPLYVRWDDANEDLFDLTVKIDGWVPQITTRAWWEMRERGRNLNFKFLSLLRGLCVCYRYTPVPRVDVQLISGAREKLAFWKASLRSVFLLEDLGEYHCAVTSSPAVSPPPPRRLDNNIPAHFRSNLKISAALQGWNILHLDFLFAVFLGSTACINMKRTVYIPSPFSALLLIKVDSYTCWIKGKHRDDVFLLHYLSWPAC